MANIALHKDFKEFLKLLNDHNVRYLVVGGYAVAFHGYPRATQDLDIWVADATGNVHRLLQALNAFGFNVPELDEWAQHPEKILRMGYPPIRIEVFASVSGLSFEHAYANRIETTFDDVEVFMLSLADLRTNKRSAGRSKDLADLEELPPIEENERE